MVKVKIVTESPLGAKYSRKKLKCVKVDCYSALAVAKKGPVNVKS